MFFHSMKYTFLSLIRNKSSMFWCIAFPILLGTMFHFAFGEIGESERFSPIPIAVVREEKASGEDYTGFLSDGWSLDEILASLAEGEDALLRITYTTQEKALELLEQKEIYGILTIGNLSFDNPSPLCLTISQDMSAEPLYQSILSALVEQFHINYQAIANIALTHPDRLPDAMEAVRSEVKYITDVEMKNGSTDPALIYFFNLIAMSCLFAAMVGSEIAIGNQANLSTLGARRCISPVHKLVSILGDICASLLFQFGAVLLSLIYLIAVLKVDFGNQIGLVALASLCGCFAGITLGFWVGSFGQFHRQIKFGILMTVIMGGCMFSGLMIGDMRQRVAETFPLLNYINPSALISDAFYALAIYPSHERFFLNIAGLVGISFLFSLGGFLLVRRKKYASL